MFSADPPYWSAAIYPIDKIDREVYADFILDWTRCHTFYTQFLCNRVFQSVKKEVALVDVLMAADTILKENADTFLERRNLLTAKQWVFLAFPRIFAESPY